MVARLLKVFYLSQYSIQSKPKKQDNYGKICKKEEERWSV